MTETTIPTPTSVRGPHIALGRPTRSFETTCAAPDGRGTPRNGAYRTHPLSPPRSP